MPDGKSDLMGYKFAKFPCNLPMNVIEGYLDSRPLLRLLSGESLSHTERPLLFTKSVSNISGMINGDSRQKLVDDEFSPSHGELQFLLAFLLCSQEKRSRCFHVIDPTIMDDVNQLYTTTPKMRKAL